MDLDLRRWLRTIKRWMDSALGSSRGSPRAESMISFVGSRSLLYIVLNFVFDLSLLDLFRLHETAGSRSPTGGWARCIEPGRGCSHADRGPQAAGGSGTGTGFSSGRGWFTAGHGHCGSAGCSTSAHRAACGARHPASCGFGCWCGTTGGGCGGHQRRHHRRRRRRHRSSC